MPRMKQLTTNIFDVALIFEGGGMRASYTAGFANMLNENELFFDNVYGLSAGASNTVNYISRDIDRTRRSFVDIVEDPHFGGPGSFIMHFGWFNAVNIYQRMGLEDGCIPFDMEAFLANPANATILSFARDTGESVYWTKKDLATIDDLMIRVRASSTLPVAMPAPEIDGVHYYDGGLGEGAGFMLPRAQADGFKRFVIVRTRPKAYRKSVEPQALSKAIDLLFWKRPHIRKALATRAVRYNAFCNEIEKLEQQGAAYVFYAEDMAVDSGETDIEKLQANYDTGYAQAYEELPALKRWLGL